MSERVPVSEWRWFGNAGHLIVGHKCRFHLATQVGPWLASTVGEYFPRGTPGEEMDTVGLGRKYETMVFAAGEPCDCGCGLPEIDGRERDVEGYNDAASATAGHYAMCEKWAATPTDSAVEDTP